MDGRRSRAHEAPGQQCLQPSLPANPQREIRPSGKEEEARPVGISLGVAAALPAAGIQRDLSFSSPVPSVSSRRPARKEGGFVDKIWSF